MRRATLLLVALVLSGCGKAFAPYSWVNGLRVLGVTAESPMLHPGEVANVGTLVVDPTQPALQQTTVWISCDPDPLNLQVDPCSQFTTIRDPNAFFSGCLATGCAPGERCDPFSQACVAGCTTGGCPAGQTCDTFTEACFSATQPAAPHVRLAGINQSASYGAPFKLFDSFAPGDPNRIRGLTATLFGITLDQQIPPPTSPTDIPRFINDFKTGTQTAESGQEPYVIAVKRIPIVDVAVAENSNPVIQAISLAGTAYAPGGLTPRVSPGQHYAINVETPPGSAECFHDVDSQGNPLQDVQCPDGSMGQVERLIAIWFTTAGAYDTDRTAIAELDNGFKGPAGTADDPIPCSDPAASVCDRTGRWWVVLQDGRGGAAWQSQRFYVCDSTQPSPSIASIAPGSLSAGATFTLTGSNLDQVLDVGLGEALVPGKSDATGSTWTGVLPSGTASGSATLTLRAKNCEDVSQAITVN